MINAISNNHAGTLAMNALQNAPAKTHERFSDAQNSELRKAFDGFVGETFFSQLLQSMRKTVGKPAYFHGGRAEEIFQQQLDQVLAQKVTEASADRFTGPM